MISELVRAEIRYVFKQPAYIAGFIASLLFFLFMFSKDQVIVGVHGENEFANSPHSMVINISYLLMMGMVLILPLVNGSATREFFHGFTEILFSTSVTRRDFFVSRFLAPLITCLLLGVLLLPIHYIAVKLGVMTGSILPSQLASSTLSGYSKLFVYVIFPNIVISSSFIYAFAISFRQSLVTIMGVLMLIMFFLLASAVFFPNLELQWLAGLMDPFGVIPYSIDTKYFTPLERNTVEISFTGYVAKNRLLWLAFSGTALVLSHFRFLAKKGSKKIAPAKAVSSYAPMISHQPLPAMDIDFSRGTDWLHFKTFFKAGFLGIMRSTVFRVVLVVFIFMLFADFHNRAIDYGLSTHPVTYYMIRNVMDYMVLILVMLVFFTGEIVGLDRSARMSEVIEATPHKTGIQLVAKVCVIIAAFMVVFVAAFVDMIALQLVQGFDGIEVSQYVGHLFIVVFPQLIFWACFTTFVQVIVHNKYLGYAITILLMVGTTMLMRYMGWTSNMIGLGRLGAIIYSDLNGYGPFLTRYIWFSVYWVWTGFVFLMLASSFWMRGVEPSFFSRIKKGLYLLRTKGIVLRIALLVGWTVLAGFVFYNTRVLNPVVSNEEWLDIREAYERTYKKYEGVPQPEIVRARFEVDIYPWNRDAYTRTYLTMQNRTADTLKALHLSLDTDWDTEVTIAGLERVSSDTVLSYQIVSFEKPLLPGDSIDVLVTSNYVTEGFENEVSYTDIVQNGSFFTTNDILPNFGYNSNIEIGDVDEREKRRLPTRDRTISLKPGQQLEDRWTNSISGTSQWIPMEVQISTSNDQVAIAPGSLVKQWEAEERNHFVYRVDRASHLFANFTSGNYVVSRKQWNGIDLEVYHSDKHVYNVDAMLDAMERSLAYYTTEYGPYPHKQARIIEFPRYSNFAQAFPGTMPYSESLGFTMDYNEDDDPNVILGVVAHEIAHQWWGHQVTPAAMQGGTMLSESFSEYSARMVAAQDMSTLELRDFQKYDYDRYLRGRARESGVENPLYRVERQSYIRYQKGVIAMYTMQAYIGEKAMNSSLKRFYDAYAYKRPYPRTVEYLRFLEEETPDSLKYLIQDLFKEVTLYDHIVESAESRLLEDGGSRVDVTMSSIKYRVNGQGEEIEIPYNEWMEVGLFADEAEEELIAIKKVKFSNGRFSFSLFSDVLPKKVVVDPRLLFFDRTLGDNRMAPPRN